MKIGDAQKPVPPKRAESVKRAQDTANMEPVSPAPAVDDISLLGIPEQELTPRIREALASLMGEVRKLRVDMAATRQRIDELETLADRDPLLDIYNRRAFAREIERGLAMMDRYAMCASLVFIDLNDLKKINDAMGHGAGDAALAHVARSLQSHVRQTDSVGRLGGDEFGVLLIEADIETAQRKAEELAQRVGETPVLWKGERFEATISWGAVEIKPGASAHEAIEKADDAMYAAKRSK